jgi:membrane-associated protease RseP (regulator of RpoE activity)
MKTMRSSASRRGITWLMALGALMVVAPPSALHAQDVRVKEDCTCVDADGKQIEKCRCLRLPDVEGMVARVVNLGSRARIGITLSSELGDTEAQGARVESVMEDGPADEAGIREGDIITSLDGQSLLEDVADEPHLHLDTERSLPVQRLMAIARELEAGQEVEVEYLRDGEPHTAVLEARELPGWGSRGVLSPDWNVEIMADRMRDLGERMREIRIEGREGRRGIHVWADSSEAGNVMLRTLPEGRAYAFSTEGGDWSVRGWECPGDEGPRRGFLAFRGECVGGLELVDLKPGLADYFGTATGVLVSDVHEDSSLGLEPGDVVLSVDGRETTSPDQLRRILRSYEGDEEITLLIVRHQQEMSVQGNLGR